MKEPVQINVETLTKQINEGMKKPELAQFYGIPVSQMGNALKSAGLKIRKFHAPSFVLVGNTISEEDIAQETNEIPVTETVEEQVAETVNSESPTWNN
jgi:hypothetical protein